MIRTFVAHVLAGLIFLALLGFLGELLGPTMTAVVSAASMIGLLLSILWQVRRENRYNRERAALMGRHAALGFPRPIGRVSRPPVGE